MDEEEKSEFPRASGETSHRTSVFPGILNADNSDERRGRYPVSVSPDTLLGAFQAV
jgi:hypothetical protein